MLDLPLSDAFRRRPLVIAGTSVQLNTCRGNIDLQISIETCIRRAEISKRLSPVSFRSLGLTMTRNVR